MYQKREHASRAFDRRFLYDATSEKRHVTSEIANLSDRRISIGNANNMFRAQPGSIKNSFEEFAPISEVSARVMKKSCTQQQVECVSMLETVQHEKGMSGARLLLRAVITKPTFSPPCVLFLIPDLAALLDQNTEYRLFIEGYRLANFRRVMMILFFVGRIMSSFEGQDCQSELRALKQTLLPKIGHARLVRLSLMTICSFKEVPELIRQDTVNPFAPDNTLSSTVERLLFNFSIWQNNPKPVGYQNVSRSRWILNKPPNKVHFFKDASSLISLERNYSPKKMTSIDNRESLMN
uniref:Uncharacterized protein n=1 Tax=Oikopleura dioica TaxID=34765 RepID=Q675U1_OIKDI|nr:hypothetical protein 004-33 [Oikopleura dioica]